jgi:hypothetical protein
MTHAYNPYALDAHQNKRFPLAIECFLQISCLWWITCGGEKAQSVLHGLLFSHCWCAHTIPIHSTGHEKSALHWYILNFVDRKWSGSAGAAAGVHLRAPPLLTWPLAGEHRRPDYAKLCTEFMQNLLMIVPSLALIWPGSVLSCKFWVVTRACALITLTPTTHAQIGSVQSRMELEDISCV